MSLSFPVSGADLLLLSTIHLPLGGFYETLVSSVELAGGRVLPVGQARQLGASGKKASPGPVETACCNLHMLPHGLYQSLI